MSEHPEFDKWWKDHGQYVRAGGGQYEISFAFGAWQASRAMALEEAAAYIENCSSLWSLANGIRALKEQA